MPSLTPGPGSWQALQYAVWGGSLVERLLVRRDVERIFEFRRRKLLERFGRPEASRAGAG